MHSIGREAVSATRSSPWLAGTRGSKLSWMLTLTSTSAAKWRRWQQSCRRVCPSRYYRPKNGQGRWPTEVSDFCKALFFYSCRYRPCFMVLWLTVKRWFCWTTSTSEIPIQSSSAVWPVSMNYLPFLSTNTPFCTVLYNTIADWSLARKRAFGTWACRL